MTQEPDLLKMLAVAENAGEAWADGEHIDIFTPTRVRLLIERVVRAERSCRLLGKIIERDGKNLVELTNSQDIIQEDGYGDWEVVWERAQEMKSRLEQAEQDRVKLRNRLDAMRRQRDGYQNQLRKTEQQVETMRAALEAIQEQHKPVIEDGLLVGCLHCDWEVDGVWPCKTRRLADQGLGGGQDG